jgi:WhiB family redox-sensing transcriptional regulator
VDIMDWRHEAACREVDPELFFPIGNTGPALLQIDEAKQVCRRCSVMDECLRWAIDSGQDAGVWGGMSEDERRALKRRTIRLRARAHVLSARVIGACVGYQRGVLRVGATGAVSSGWRSRGLARR